MTTETVECDAWAKLEKLAREIDPTLPADLSGYEIRIILNRDFQVVECIALSYKDVGA
jgi:hypothetical protein